MAVVRLGEDHPCYERPEGEGKTYEIGHVPDTDADGKGRLKEDRMYQLVRQPGTVEERTFEITFLEAGVEAYVFTFG